MNATVPEFLASRARICMAVALPGFHSSSQPRLLSQLTAAQPVSYLKYVYLRAVLLVSALLPWSARAEYSIAGANQYVAKKDGATCWCTRRARRVRISKIRSPRTTRGLTYRTGINQAGDATKAFSRAIKTTS